MEFSSILNFTLLFLFLASSSNAIDSITPNTTFKDTGDTLVSFGGQFELAFVNIGSTGRYLGIRYHNYANNTVIWVANRNTPLNDTSGVLSLKPDGTLYLTCNTTSLSAREIWSTNVSSSNAPKYPIARLLDTGNLVVVDLNSGDNFYGNYLWESFDYPGNTFMPSIKFGRDLVTGLDIYLSSWKLDNEDPSEENFSYNLDPFGYPQLFLWKGNQIEYRSGPWNGQTFSGMPYLQPNSIYTFEFVMDEKQIYYQYSLIDSKLVSRMTLSSKGIIITWVWDKEQED
ncbi:hypothetical protein RDABS01_032314 [Bienertia sinuspersici]